MTDSPPGSTQASPPAEANDLPHCKCGTNRLSKFSVAGRDYSFTGYLYLLWGGTSVPSKVSFSCVKCGDIFESTTKRSVCKQHTT